MSKKCPFCAETIQEDAKKCRFCGEWLSNDKPKENIKRPTSINRYFYIWIASILAFFSTFLFSVNGFISDTVTLIVIGIFAIIGTLSFLIILYSMTRPAARGSRMKYALFCLIGFALFFILAKIDPPVFRAPPNETGLRNTIEKQYELSNQGEQGLREIYKSFLSLSSKDITEEEYLTEALTHLQSEGIQASKYDIHDVYIDGAEGYVDRTVYDCADSSCNNILNKSRQFRKYVYENQKWLMTTEPVACPRKSMYDMEPEFSRALSLVSQRLPAENNAAALKNCINVRYATSIEEMENAEGQFRFIPGQSVMNLNIVVSPKYQEKDDLLTAFLLAHEVQHAANYSIGLLQGTPINCFEDEGTAFNAQYFFMTKLNKEESQSILSRGYNPSQEIVNIATTYNAIQRQPGSDFIVKATNYVKANPFYQEQCAGR